MYIASVSSPLTQFQEIVRKNPEVSPRQNVNMTSKADSFSCSRDIVTVITDADDYDSGILLTKVNNKDGYMKFSEPQRKEVYIEGEVSGKKIYIHKKGNVYTGKYGNKEFELTADVGAPSSNVLKRMFTNKSPNKYSYFNVSGKLGDKDVSINMPNSKIPEDEDFKDILSLMLWTKHQKAKTIGGEIKSIEFSNDGYRHKKEMEEISDKQHEKFWSNPIVATGLTILSTLGISWLTKKLL